MTILCKAEFENLLYFTSARDENIGLDILERLMQDADTDQEDDYDIEFLIDVAFECHKPAAAKFVWEKLLSSDRTVTISSRQSAHTVYGHLFILDDCQLVMYAIFI